VGVVEALTEDEKYLYILLQDHAGIDICEFALLDEEREDGCWRAWPFQWTWWRNQEPLQLDQCARSVGKSQSICARAIAFPFVHPGNEMVLTAPEKVHLDAITNKVETEITKTRLLREMLKGSGRTAFKHQPFHVDFANGARIMGRIPQRDGRGIKGTHPLWLEQDEASDYPEPGWMELVETLKRGHEGAVWRAHGVTRGVRDSFYKFSQPGSGWKVHRISAMARPTWSDEERQEKIRQYGSKDAPDYRRNILGEHGDASSPMFVLHRLMACWSASTPVHIVNSNSEDVTTIPIEDVQVGDRVLNATGTGVVTNVTTSRHERIARLRLDGGEALYCTPDHPVFTERGWVAVGDLEAGDLLVDVEDLRGVWRIDHGSGEDLLLGDVPGRGIPQEPSDPLRTLRGAAGPVPEEVLLDGVLGGLEATAAALDDLSVPPLHGAADPQRSAQVLLDRLCVRRTNGEAASVQDLRGSWVRGGGARLEPEVLLGLLLIEQSERDVSGLLSAANHQALRALWGRVLSSFEEGSVLFDDLFEPADEVDSELRSVRGRFHAGKANSEVLLKDVRVRVPSTAAEGQDGNTAHAAGRSRGSAPTPVPAVVGAEGTGDFMDSSVLDVAIGGSGSGGGLVQHRHRRSNEEAGDRGGWAGSQVQDREGSDARRVAHSARVESVEVLQRGDRDFDQLCGDGDHVVCYDLTVSGHPSFVVGDSRVLVHNCVDDDEFSDYNQDLYRSLRITGEMLEQDPISMLLNLDTAHKGSTWLTHWIGADIGWTQAPTEILVFGEMKPNKTKPSILQLLYRLNLTRVGGPDQVRAMTEIIRFFSPKAFAMDSTGAGLPLFQQLQEESDLGRVVKGYNFKEKILVDFDKTIEVDPYTGDAVRDAGIKRQVLEYSTDTLRRYVDEQRLLLPWDRDLIGQFQGGSIQAVKAGMDEYGRRRISSSAADHALDASRMAVLAHALYTLEEMVKMKRRTPVIDSFMMV
jgi:hypothetical protein